LSHIAYHAELITDTLPLTWTELVTDVEGQFVFPAAGPTGATLALQFYFANGGTLVNDAGQLALQAEPLTAALSQFTMAQNNNFLAAADTSLSTVVETWQLFQGNSSALVLTTADQYLALRSTEFAPLFIPVPGPQEPLTPLVDGWAWAITTTDPTRRTLALELLAILTTDNNLGEWSFASRVLPAQEGAFAAWPDDDEYVAFVKMELEAADAFPLNASGDVLTIFQNALLNVTALGVPPSAAAEQAVQTLQP
jgi:ABC-type glycerol-3-phosphate transport system substrate-binding protein